MSFDKMDALEVRVRRLVDRVQDMQQANTSLRQELSLAKKELSKRGPAPRGWELEREQIKSRIEKVIGELDSLESADREEVADGKTH